MVLLPLRAAVGVWSAWQRRSPERRGEWDERLGRTLPGADPGGLWLHGASLGEIGDVLGHRHPQTTKIYTKVDLDALRTLALPWPGGAR